MSPFPTKTRKRRFLKYAVTAAVLYLSACGYFWAVQSEKIFDPLATIATDPSRMGMNHERVEIPVPGTHSGVALDAFWVPAEQADAPVLLYLHGRNASIGKNLDHTYRFHQMGYHVLVPDYRGYGKSYDTITPTESSVYEDAEAAWNYLTIEKETAPGRIFIYGHSLGGAVAIELAKRHPKAAGLITEGTFTSVLDMSSERYHGLLRLLPMKFLLRARFDSIGKIGSLKIPVLLIHGTADPKIPSRMSEELYQAAPSPKSLALIEGAEHTNCGWVGLVQYREAVTTFVEDCRRRQIRLQAEEAPRR